MTKVHMIPGKQFIGDGSSGIAQVIKHYYELAPKYDIEYVENENEADIIATHAGATGKKCDVAHLHGVYWTAHYNASMAEIKANANIVNTVRGTKQITVPTNWVAELFQRDMRKQPVVIPHGINWKEWEHNYENKGYILWNKNRAGQDVCDPTIVGDLANNFTSDLFVATFAPKTAHMGNIQTTGKVPHDQMKRYIQECAVYLALTKETFGIGTLEAMASGKPVLGWAYGGNLDLIEHGVNGYLAEPNNIDDLIEGLNYCLAHQKVLGKNGAKMAQKWTWENAFEKVAEVYRKAATKEPAKLDIVIPHHNYSDTVERAIRSCAEQTFKPENIIIVDDNSTSEHLENLRKIVEKVRGEYEKQNFVLLESKNGNVADTRNDGIRQGNGKYVTCLDADDAIEPQFAEACIEALEKDSELGIAYTALVLDLENGREKISSWPAQMDHGRHFKHMNQVPTCNVFRREMWEATGGYRNRYCPDGAGSEDAAFWTSALVHGWDARMVTEAPLFRYSYGHGAVSGNSEYREVSWLADYQYEHSNENNFASLHAPKNKVAHQVRQYDEPMIAVVIPVGPGHEKNVARALDSVESQTMRMWEAIVAWDSDKDIPQEYYKIYPYVKWIKSDKPKMGAGHARNKGVETSRAPFIVYLDADDFILPTLLERMLHSWNIKQEIIYTDYLMKAHIDDDEAISLKKSKLLHHYEGAHKPAIISNKGVDYDCTKFFDSIKKRKEKFYHWNIVTSFVPRAWHDGIGGFDESMVSWEDVDYWWRLAWAGHCFTRIAEPLVMYNFDSGTRRHIANAENEKSRVTGVKLLNYMLDKLEATETMGCKGCGRSRPVNPRVNVVNTQQYAPQLDEQMVMIEYVQDEFRRTGNTARHEVIGITAFATEIPGIKMKRKGGNFYITYGTHKISEEFLVHKLDLAAMPHRFREVRRTVAPPPSTMMRNTSTPIGMDAPVSIEQKGFNLGSIVGITPVIASQMNADGIDSLDKLASLDKDALMAYNGCGSKRAEQIIVDVAKKLGD